MVFGLFSMVFAQALDRYNGERFAIQLGISGILCARFALAEKRNERNRIWVAYVIMMFATVLLWMLVYEPFVWWVIDLTISER